MGKDTAVVTRLHGSVRVASPVRTGLSVDVRLRIPVVHVLTRGRIGASLGILVLGWALRRDGGVYWNITVRFHLLRVLLGILMGSAILKIQ